MKETYGLKKDNGFCISILVAAEGIGFMGTRFVGGFGGYKVKEWKTLKGAERAAKQFTGSEIFTMDTHMNY